MKIIKNETLIKRNAKIGSWTSLAALVVLGLGMYISFTRPELFAYSLIALLLGFTLTQVGMFLGNKFGRSPRPDERLDASLKGLSNEHTIYHYTAPASHVLVGPAGVWVIKPYHQRGQVTFSRNRWRMSGGGFLQSYMRIFGQEGLGRPDAELESDSQSVRKHLLKQMEEADLPEINPLMVFLNEQVELDADEAPIPAIKLKQLKDFYRQRAKGKVLSQDQIAQVNKALS